MNDDKLFNAIFGGNKLQEVMPGVFSVGFQPDTVLDPSLWQKRSLPKIKLPSKRADKRKTQRKARRRNRPIK